MDGKSNGRLQVMVSLEGGLLASVQIFQSHRGAQKFWDASIEEAKERSRYETLSSEAKREFDQDPFGYAYGGEKDLVWEEATVKD